jgi:hypothetical protein
LDKNSVIKETNLILEFQALLVIGESSRIMEETLQIGSRLFLSISRLNGCGIIVAVARGMSMTSLKARPAKFVLALSTCHVIALKIWVYRRIE